MLVTRKIKDLCRSSHMIQRSFAMQQEPARMEKSLNSVQLLGRVGADPQKKGSDEHPIAVFSLATHTNYRYDSGEFLQRTEWHRIVCFKPGLRETVLNYLKKGQRVHVTGRITYGEIKGDDGSTRSTTAIAADDVIFFNTSTVKAASLAHTKIKFKAEANVTITDDKVKYMSNITVGIWFMAGNLNSK